MKSILCVVLASVAVSLVLFSSPCQGGNLGLDALKSQFLPAEFRNKNFTIDDFKRIYREKCKKITGVDNSTLYTDIEKGVFVLKDCISKLVNVSGIQQEIDDARPLGELDTVFSKYCSKAPEASRCIRDFNDKIQPCLSAEERNQNNIMVRIATNLMGFMCSKGGDQIALFVAEEGPECLEANKEAISHCVNSSFSEFISKDGRMPDIFNLPELVWKPEHCIDLEKFEACTIHHLEQCTEITPANVAESIFKFVKNETSCLDYMQKKGNERSILRDPRNSAASSTICLIAAIFAILLAFILNN